LVIPLVFGTSHFGGYGPLFVSLLIAFATHSIIRYRLMDIRVVVRQGIIYLLSVTVAGGFFVVLLMALSLATATSPAELPHLLHLSLVLLVAVLFQPLKERTQRALDRYVYRRRYDYLRAIRTATRAISALLDLDSLVHYLRDMTVATFQPETVAVYVRDGNRQFVQVARHRLIDSDPPGEPTAFPSDSPLVRILTDSRSYLLRDDVPDAPRTLTGDVTNRVLHELNIDLALPLFDGNHLIAMILVGPKLSGDPYFSDDIELMVTLAQQAAVALRNAQLYQEVTLARDYISNLLATLENGVIAVDATGVVTQFNPAAERLTSLPTSKAVNNTLDVLPAPLAASLAQTLATQGSRVQDEVTLLEDTGRLVPAVCSTSTLRDRDGRPLGAVMVFGDITHLKELEADKRRAERLASFGSLASGIAHEIKNPLVAIRTFAELLPDRYSDEDFRSGFAEIVVKEITRIDDLVARLRGLAAPPAPPFGTVDLAESIDETLTLLRAKLEQQNISVRKDFTAASSRVTGDPSQLKQLFLNLFLNAVDAIGASGTLAVKVSERFGANMSNGVIVDISDTGCGIPTDLLPKIFEPFVTSKRTGSGLGLAICRGIADAHGAKIRAFNNEGYGGATIRLEFSLPSSPLSLTLKPD
jgi:PAS domain S-box-containing protein